MDTARSIRQTIDELINLLDNNSNNNNNDNDNNINDDNTNDNNNNDNNTNDNNNNNENNTDSAVITSETVSIKQYEPESTYNIIQCENFEKVLLIGYIGDAEKLLTNNLLSFIPDSIINLCFMFYSLPKILYLQYYLSPKTQTSQFGFCNIESKKIDKFTLNNKSTSNDPVTIRTSCFVPNMTNSLHNISDMLSQSMDININRYSYDGVVSVIKQNNMFYPCLSIFEGDNYYQRFISNDQVPFKPQRDIIFCGRQHGIIYYGKDNKLYQLKLDELMSKNFNFKEIDDTNVDIEDGFRYQRFTSNGSKYLHLQYLDNYDQLFVIKCFRSNRAYQVHWHSYGDNLPIKSKECKLFSLNTFQWKSIKTYKYHNDLEHFRCGTCFDGANNVYLVSNTGYTSTYDLAKDEWMTINTKNEKSFYKHIVWIDRYRSNILNCISHEFGGNILKIQIKCLDIREKNAKWISSSIHIDKLEIDEDYKIKIFR